MKGKKNLGIAMALVIAFGPFGFIYLGWKSFLVAIIGVIIIIMAVANQSKFVICASVLIFEILLFEIMIIWRRHRYRKREKFFTSSETCEEINGKKTEYKKCTFCGEQTLQIAKKCKYCGEFLDPKAVNFTKQKSSYGGLITFVILIIIILLGYMSRYAILFYTGTILEFNGGQLSCIDPVTNSEAQNLGKFLTEQG